MKRTMAVILAGGEGERLSILSGVRAKPAVPFGGKYRIIDFTLSNCVNSDIDNVVVLTQYNPRSLNDHIGLGRPWDLDRNHGGVKMLQPYIARGRVAEWYRGTADAVLQNFNVIEHDSSRHDPRPRRRPHLQDGLPAVHRGPPPQARRRHDRRPPRAARRTRAGWASSPSTTTTGSSSGRRSRSSPRATSPRWASTSSRRRRSGAGSARTGSTSAGTSSRRCSTPTRGSSAIASRATGRTSGRSSRTGRRTWRSSQDNAELDLYDKDWVIHTRSEERAPAKVGPTAQVHRSLISHGCVINGTVVNSVLSPGVRVDVGAVVRDSIVMFDCVIRSGAVVDRSILDKEVVVGQGAIVGDGPDFDTPNRQEPGRLNTGHHRRRQAGDHPSRRADRAQREGRRATSGRPTSRPKVIKNGASVDAGARDEATRAGASAATADARDGSARRRPTAPARPSPSARARRPRVRPGRQRRSLALPAATED